MLRSPDQLADVVALALELLPPLPDPQRVLLEGLPLGADPTDILIGAPNQDCSTALPGHWSLVTSSARVSRGCCLWHAVLVRW